MENFGRDLVFAFWFFIIITGLFTAGIVSLFWWLLS